MRKEAAGTRETDDGRCRTRVLYKDWRGGVPERSNGAVLKTAGRASVP